MEQLFRLFDAIQPLSNELKAYLISILIPLELKKKSIILKEGQISNRIYFIEKGLVKSTMNVEGEEKTVWIMKEGDIILSVESFFAQTRSIERIETVENCSLQACNREHLYTAYKKYPEFNLHRAVILEKYYSLSEARNRMRHMDARDKFEYLISTQPELITRKSVSDKMLASFLGITPGTYSLRKNNYFNQGRTR